MLHKIPNALTCIALVASLTFTTAQRVGQINDGQIQNPTATAAPVVQPAPKFAQLPSAAPPPPVNHTFPPAAVNNGPAEAPKEIPNAYPSGKMPLYTANTTLPTFPSASAAIIAGNATAPAVPAVPQPSGVDTGNGAGVGASPTGTGVEAPKEAGTSAPAVANANGVGRVGAGALVGWWGLGMMVGMGLAM